MTPDDQAFVDLCAALRALGATSVEREGRKATFTAQLPKQPVKVAVQELDDPLERFPRKTR